MKGDVQPETDTPSSEKSLTLCKTQEEKVQPDPQLIPSVQLTHSVVFDSLRPHEPQHTRPPCPSPTPGVHPNSCPLSRWCHPTISSSVVPFSSCPQSFPASGFFPMGQLFASGGQSTGASASASVLPMNEHSGLMSFRMDWLDLLAIQGTLKSLLQHQVNSRLVKEWNVLKTK